MMLRWAQDHRIEWHYIAPGKPIQNGPGRVGGVHKRQQGAQLASIIVRAVWTPPRS